MRNLITKKVHDRLILSFVDLIILDHLQTGKKVGYDIINLLHDKFNLSTSSGTIYSKLYAIERLGLIKGEWTGEERDKRFYTLTEEGKQKLDALLSSTDNDVQDLLKILGINSKKD